MLRAMSVSISLKTRGLAIGAVLVLLCHSIMQFLLYRARVFYVFTLADSDIVVFLVPALLAIAGYAALFSRFASVRPWSWFGKTIFIVVVTAAVGFLSFWWSMFLAIGFYGE